MKPPFSPLIPRVRLRLQRRAEELRYADLVLSPGTREVRRGQRTIDLTPTEFGLLELFLRNPERVLSRHEIFTSVWGYDFGGTSNALNVFIGYVRRKLEAEGEARLLHTVRSVGYVLRKNGS